MNDCISVIERCSITKSYMGHIQTSNEVIFKEILGVRHRTRPQKAFKVHALTNFLEAHLMAGNLPLAIDLSNKEVTMLKKDGKCYFEGAFRSPTEERKEDAKDNVTDGEYVHRSRQCIIPYSFS